MSLVVLTVPERLERGRALADSLGAWMWVDVHSNPTIAHADAWKDAAQRITWSDEWVGVIEDDAIPIWDQGVGGSFRGRIENAPPRGGLLGQMLSTAPCNIVSGYLGTSRPQSNQDDIALTLHLSDPAWIVSRQLRHHVAVFMRARLVPRAVKYMREHPNTPCDEAISIWAQQALEPVAYCNPSLFDHDDDLPPAVRADQRRLAVGDGPRRAWHTGTRESYPATDARFLDAVSEKIYRRRYGEIQGAFRSPISHS
ncbi:glucosyltransferase [Gordonia phage Neville]|uniref:Glycosyltransferase n=1 Tax=Gordonia phage Neville TaxID=2301693 RepID=A0A385DY68_9CAUD|nr:glucosyltransferase [Gordonia phage Neville]AXQ64480.1 glycosyltransferase [Gordonia phage Neville]